MSELWQALVQVSASVNAILLGLVIIFSRRLHRTRSRRKLGAALLSYGYLLLAFTARDNLWVPFSSLLLLADGVIVLLASALFLDYVSGSLRRVPASRLCYLPPLLFLVLAAGLGEAFVLGPAMNLVIVLQVIYTLITTLLFLRQTRGLASWPRHLPVLLGSLWVMHLFQLSRMLMPEVGWLFDLIPLAGAAIFLMLTVLVLTDPQALRTPAQAGIAMPASQGMQAVEAYMRAEKPYLDPQLSLARLAEAVGLAPRDLSGLIGSSADGSFYPFVNRFRVAEARQLLADPAEARTSIEAIGLMAGFRSRSTFYEAFRRSAGMTPAQYRSAHSASAGVSG